MWHTELGHRFAHDLPFNVVSGCHCMSFSWREYYYFIIKRPCSYKVDLVLPAHLSSLFFSFSCGLSASRYATYFRFMLSWRRRACARVQATSAGEKRESWPRSNGSRAARRPVPGFASSLSLKSELSVPSERVILRAGLSLHTCPDLNCLTLVSVPQPFSSEGNHFQT